MLHLIFQRSTNTLFERVTQDDGVLFLHDAVFDLLKTSHNATQLARLPYAPQLYVLLNDLQIRGIAVKMLIDGVQVIDYQGFVVLTSDYTTICSWT